ncbi:MAG: 6,7-dimethyl-8-ribityllumazine synthase [Neisseriaceae bacterium]
MKVYHPELKGRGLKIGIVRSRFSEEIGLKVFEACMAELEALQVKEKNITCLSVPGALEIPVGLQSLLLKSDFDALIAIGVVIRGDTYHFEIVANGSAQGVSRVALDFNVPIANAVLTTEDEEQALERAAEKGAAAARVAIEMANHLRNLKIKCSKENSCS